MKCTDCENYYLGCDTEVFNYGYEQFIKNAKEK